MFHTKETIIRVDWIDVYYMVVAITLFICGAATGIGFIRGEEEVVVTEKEEVLCPVGFATYDDMYFLVKELRLCTEIRGRWDGE